MLALSIAEWVVWGVALALGLCGAFAIRETGVRRLPPFTWPTLVLALALVGFPAAFLFLPFSKLHIVWLVPVTWLLSLLAGFSYVPVVSQLLIWPAYVYARLLMLGTGWTLSSPSRQSPWAARRHRTGDSQVGPPGSGPESERVGAILARQIAVFECTAPLELVRSRVPWITERTPAGNAEQLERFMAALREADPNMEITKRARIGGFGGHAIELVVSDQWRYAPYELRLRFAEHVWAVWARIHSQNPSIPKLHLLDEEGRKLGGSHSWTGSAISLRR